jgi:hypothetical protein
MTTTTAHAGHHISIRTVALALAGAVLAAGAGYGVATLVLDEGASLEAPTQSIAPRDPNFDPNGFAGTNREDRALQHRG